MSDFTIPGGPLDGVTISGVPGVLAFGVVLWKEPGAEMPMMQAFMPPAPDDVKATLTAHIGAALTAAAMRMGATGDDLEEADANARRSMGMVNMDQATRRVWNAEGS